MQPVNVGIIGCGTISAAYLRMIKKMESLQVIACADLVHERAEACAREFDIPRACSVAELIKDPQIELILNLTIPIAHAEVARAVLEAGKSVYSEKPLGVTRAEGQELVDLARKHGLLIGCAPDTFLGGGLQTCRKLIDEGAIGVPVAATAFMMGHGPESWHPSPVFYYERGGGPLLDMGPYYITALVHLLGPVQRVSAVARSSFPERTITSEPLYGQTIQVEVPTHVAGQLEFASGPIGTLITSFDVWGHHCPRIEIHGSEGSLSVPDPNTFGGPVLLLQAGSKEWQELPLSHGYTSNSRGIGLADMAYAMRSGRKHRASGELAFHVLDCMESMLDSSDQGRHMLLDSTCERPAPLPVGLQEGRLDP